MILGVDPGKEGGFALIGGGDVIVEPMPQTEDEQLDIGELGRLLHHYADDVTMAYVEVPGLRPHQDPGSALKSGVCFGAILATLTAYGIRYQVVQPREWSEGFPHGVVERDKHKRYHAIKVARRRIVERVFPGIDLRKNGNCKVAHDGMVDALLIAEWGRRQRSGGV